MAEFVNSLELRALKEKMKTLQDGDIITWPAGISCPPYKVILIGEIPSLENTMISDHSRDDQIFPVLEIKKPIKFCKNCFGYYPSGDVFFPSPKKNDNEALTRLVVALMEKAEALLLLP